MEHAGSSGSETHWTRKSESTGEKQKTTVGPLSHPEPPNTVLPPFASSSYVAVIFDPRDALFPSFYPSSLSLPDSRGIWRISSQLRESLLHVPAPLPNVSSRSARVAEARRDASPIAQLHSALETLIFSKSISRETAQTLPFFFPLRAKRS